MKINIAQFFKAIGGRDPPGEKEFLKQLRVKLVDYARQNPLVSEKSEKLAVSQFQFKPVPLAIVLTLTILASGTFVYSQNSLPGNALYPVKLLSEKIRSVAALNPQRAADLHINLAQKRIIELENLLDTMEEGNRGRAKKKINIDDVLNNFTSQIEKVSNKAQALREKGELEGALETNNDLKRVIDFYRNRLEADANKEKLKEDEKEMVARALSSAGNVGQGADAEIKSISQYEQERVKEWGFEYSARGKMEAAKNKIDEVQHFIDEREEKSRIDGKYAESKLDEAERLFAEAKSLYFNEHKYEEALEKSRGAFETASLVKTLVKIFPESPKVANKKDEDREGRATRTSSSSSPSLPSGNNKSGEGDKGGKIKEDSDDRISGGNHSGKDIGANKDEDEESDDNGGGSSNSGDSDED